MDQLQLNIRYGCQESSDVLSTVERSIKGLLKNGVNPKIRVSRDPIWAAIGGERVTGKSNVIGCIIRLSEEDDDVMAYSRKAIEDSEDEEDHIDVENRKQRRVQRLQNKRDMQEPDESDEEPEDNIPRKRKGRAPKPMERARKGNSKVSSVHESPSDSILRSSLSSAAKRGGGEGKRDMDYLADLFANSEETEI
jgi:hypothetical protein